MRLLAIDPGDVQSALVLYDTADQRLVWWAKVPNHIAVQYIAGAATGQTAELGCDELAIEMIASYGMPVGRTTFETCVWIGRFVQTWEHYRSFLQPAPRMVYRLDVKVHLCRSAKARDSNVRQALVDRFGGTDRLAKGTKRAPGPLYGLSGDGWAALGVAITAAETPAGEESCAA